MSSCISIKKKDGSSEQIYFLENIDIISVGAKIKFAMKNASEITITSELHKEPIIINGSEIESIKVKS